jgi:predicted  nucleic acid-binding Zn-ribbon protein
MVTLSTKSDLTVKKDKAEKDLKLCKADVLKCRSDTDECKREGERKDREIQDVKNQVDKATKDLAEAKKDLENKKKDLDRCNTEHATCKTNLETLTKQVNECQSSITNINNQINELKAQLDVKIAEHAKLVSEIYTYQIGLVISGVTHVGIIIEDVYTHVTKTTCLNNLMNCTNNFLNCNGSLQNCHGEINVCKRRVEILEKEVKDCDGDKVKCKQNSDRCDEELKKVKEENAGLRAQVEKLPIMGVEQAMMHELVKEANYTYTSLLLYNGSHDGYHKSDFIRTMGPATSSVIIVRTKTGLVFGGFLGIRWEPSGGWRKDDKAFIFSGIPYSQCTIYNQEAVNFDAEFMEFRGSLVVSSSNSKTTNGYYQCVQGGGQRIDFEVVDMYGFGVNLAKKT